MLAKPGRTLEEVKEQLAERRSVDREERDAARHALVDEVKTAWSQGAEAIVEHDDIELCRKVVLSASVSEGTHNAGATGAPRGDVELRHRFDRPPSKRSSAARVVTLRDRRRGRPRRSDASGDSDPPG